MNKVILMGRLTRDPEVRYSNNNMAIASFTLAVDRPVREGIDKQADFPSCKAFGKTAELLQKYCSKGKAIIVEGRLQTGSYQNKEGKTVYTTEVIVDRLEFLPGTSKAEPVEPSNDDVPGFTAIPEDDIPF